MDKFGLSAKTITAIIELFKQYGEIQEVRIFGSRAKGNFKLASDIDLAIFGCRDEKILRRIASQLDELPTPYKFDIIDYNSAPHNLKLEIDKFSKEFYKK